MTAQSAEWRRRLHIWSGCCLKYLYACPHRGHQTSSPLFLFSVNSYICAAIFQPLVASQSKLEGKLLPERCLLCSNKLWTSATASLSCSRLRWWGKIHVLLDTGNPSKVSFWDTYGSYKPIITFCKELEVAWPSKLAINWWGEFLMCLNCWCTTLNRNQSIKNSLKEV